MPATGQLPHELSDILARNGMQASIVRDDAGQPSLIVQGHDSPVLTYALTSQQLQNLTGWGSTFHNKQSYNTFADIVAKDFDLPKDFVHARNANTRVAMGLHGYRIGVGEYGRMPAMTPRRAFMMGMPMGFGGQQARQRGFWQVLTPFLGWTGRMQDGYHLRRMGGMLVTPQGAPIVPERPDGRMKPGELQSGGYGFYWKGGSVDRSSGVYHSMEIDPLDQFQVGVPSQTRKDSTVPPMRSTDPAKPFRDLVSSDVYFTAEKFMECLDSHGLILNKENGELVIQSSKVDADLTYSIDSEDMKVLTSNSLKEHTMADRLSIINKILEVDFRQPITMDMLNSKDRIGIELTPQAQAELSQVSAIHREEVSRNRVMSEAVHDTRSLIGSDGIIIPIISEKEGYHWEQDARHGRDVVLGNVVAYESQGKYFLRADINGTPMVKDLTEKEFQEIRYRNDDRRLELVDSHLEGIRLSHGDYQGEVVNTNITHGEDLGVLTQDGKGWYREGKDGREVTVGDIEVHKESSGKFIMTAQIDGQTVQHEISQKDFNRFLQMDDLHRMKLFSRIFDEVDIKSNVAIGTKVGAAVAATLTVLGEMSMGAEPIMSQPRGEAMHGPSHRAYFKPGVDSPMDIAARNFEAAMVTEQIHHGIRQ